MIMLLFKSHLSKSRGFFFSLSPFCEYHHQLETIGASASQEYIVLNKKFLQKGRQRRQNFAKKIRILLVWNLDWKQIMPPKTLDVQNLNPFRNTERKKKNRHPPRAPRSCSTSLSITTCYNCLVALKTKENPTNAAFLHLLYVYDEMTPTNIHFNDVHEILKL